MSSPEDHELFLKTVGRVKRIHSDRVLFPRKKIALAIRQPDYDASIHHVDMMSDDLSWTSLDFDMPMRYLKTGYDRQILKQIEKGKVPLSLTIDLHGRGLTQARDELSAFLYHALENEHKFVKIIHGQGYNSASGPVLRNKVNEWLRLRTEVIAFANAPQKMGGKGATICLLKKTLIQR